MSGFKYVRVLNICKFSKIWQGSEYTLGCNYIRVLNIPWFQVCQFSVHESVVQGSEYASIWLNNVLWQSFEYTWSTFHRVLNKPPVLNMLGLRIWQYDVNISQNMLRICEGYTEFWIYLIMAPYSSIMPEYALISISMPEHGWILLNLPECA